MTEFNIETGDIVFLKSPMGCITARVFKVRVEGEGHLERRQYSGHVLTSSVKALKLVGGSGVVVFTDESVDDVLKRAPKGVGI